MRRVVLTNLSAAVLIPVAAFADGDAASLDRLHGIVMPDAVPWWPPAPGWYVVMLVLALAGLFAARRFRQRSQARRYRVEALSELEQLAPRETEARRYAGDVMILLRRTALAAWPREEIVALKGDAWWRFLDDSADSPLFASELGPLCEQLAYGAPGDVRPPDLEARLGKACRIWITTHKTPVAPRRDGAASEA